MKLPILILLTLCSVAAAQTTQPTTQIATIADPAIRESSGIVESRRFPGVYWTHNDSGSTPFIYAIDRTGKTLASYRVAATNSDWEDIAIDDEGHLYIADIGNNAHRKHDRSVYQIDEPDPQQKADMPLRVRQTWKLRYPAAPFDAESLFIHGQSGYIISKHRDGTPASVYRFPLTQNPAPIVLAKLLELPIRLPVTAADISRDGKQVAILTIGGPYLYDLPTAGDVASILHAKPRWVLFADLSMEGLCLTTEGLLATTEQRSILLFRWTDFSALP